MSIYLRFEQHQYNEIDVGHFITYEWWSNSNLWNLLYTNYKQKDTTMEYPNYTDVHEQHNDKIL